MSFSVILRFFSLNTEEERQAFDIKFRNHIASKTEDEKKEFAASDLIFRYS